MDFIRAFKILSRIGYQEVNESDDGRFVLMSQYLRKVLNAYKKSKKLGEHNQTLEPESL